MVLSKKEKLSPTLEFSEYLVSPSQLTLIFHKNLDQLTVFDMKSIARCALLRTEFVQDVSQKEKISPSTLLLADPYLVLHPTSVQLLFDIEKSTDLVPSSLLKEVRHHFSDIPVSANTSYQSLQNQLNKLSIFAGRNPMVSGIICR